MGKEFLFSKITSIASGFLTEDVSAGSFVKLFRMTGCKWRMMVTVIAITIVVGIVTTA